MASCSDDRGGQAMSARSALTRGFSKLPPGFRRRILHRLGRYAPWEQQFSFSPPALSPGEAAGPPDFVGIGAQKAGTTWWQSLLATHPGVSSRGDIHKERHFFDRFGLYPFGPSDVDLYHRWFPRREGTITGEWTPDYFDLPWVAPLLRRAAPHARLLLLVRDPVERFSSGLAHQIRHGIPCDTTTIFYATERGFYERTLTGWLEHFEADQLLVLQYEQCEADPDAQLAITFEFLGLTEYHLSDAERPPRPDLSPQPALDVEVRKRLVDLYAEDVAGLAARFSYIDLKLWPNFSYLLGDVPAPVPASVVQPSSPTRRTYRGFSPIRPHAPSHKP